MGEVLCSTENSPFLIIDHIHAKINRVCCAALAIGKRCMNVRKNKLFMYDHVIRNPTLCICENKGTDQLCCYKSADQLLL